MSAECFTITLYILLFDVSIHWQYLNSVQVGLRKRLSFDFLCVNTGEVSRSETFYYFLYVSTQQVSYVSQLAQYYCKWNGHWKILFLLHAYLHLSESTKQIIIYIILPLRNNENIFTSDELMSMAVVLSASVGNVSCKLQSDNMVIFLS